MQNNLTALQEKVEELEKRIMKLEDRVLPKNDVLIKKAIEIIKVYERVSASMIQRRLMIGYARAASIIDLLEQKGFVSSAEGAKPRKVLIKK